MRVATLQLDSALGDVEGNIKKADALLICHRDRLEKLDLLVLPELVFAGKLSLRYYYVLGLLMTSWHPRSLLTPHRLQSQVFHRH
jgi:hypothetical protein